MTASSFLYYDSPVRRCLCLVFLKMKNGIWIVEDTIWWALVAELLSVVILGFDWIG